MALEYILIQITYYQTVLSIFVVSVVSCVRVCVCVSDIDTDFVHFQPSIDKYWICERNVYMHVCVCV